MLHPPLPTHAAAAPEVARPEPSRSSVCVARVGVRSVVVDSRSSTPLRLLEPRNHGHAAWVYQSSHGGGFVGADRVALDIEVRDGATLFLGSQASSKVYRRTDARFELTGTVGADALLVSWPDPVVCFAGASLDQSLSLRLQPSGSALVVDAFSAGRVARGERWAFARLRSRLRIDVGATSALREGLVLDPAHGELAERLAGVGALATVVCLGPALAAAGEQLVATLDGEPPSRSGEPLCVGSRVAGGVVLRLAASDTQSLQLALRVRLAPHVTALLGDDPAAHRV